MIRALIQDAAVSAAKSYSHEAVEPRHVLFALARHFKANPACAEHFAAAKRALDPPGSSHGTPPVSAEAAALLETLRSDADGIAALDRAFSAAGGSPPGATGEAAAGAQPGGAATTAAKPEEAAETTPDILAELDALVGMDAVKTQVRRIIAVVQANTERRKAGLTPVNPGLHLVFTGPPGTGKTTVARIVARLYAATGALPGAKFTEAGRSDLVAGYVGQTALKTREVMDKSRPGVLFIDEAYSLTPSSHVDFGHEAIATLVKGMEDHREELAVIVAGYEEEMTEFIESNPGLRSRFKTRIGFPDYSARELTSIFERMSAEVGIGLAEGTLPRAEQVFAHAAARRDFGNARYARSLFEQAYTRMAARAAQDGVVTVDELGILQPEDVHDDHSTLAPVTPRIGF